MLPGSPAALQLMRQQEQRGAAAALSGNNFNGGSTSGAIDLSHLLRSPVPGMGHTLSRSYSLRG
jgi:hypothetical protein